jgi:hypothetical protein
MIQLILALYILTTVGIDSKDVALSKPLWHYNMYYGLLFYLIKTQMCEAIDSV